MSSVKTSWLEVVGWPATDAAMQISSDRPDVAVEVLQIGANVAPGYDALRDRVYFDGGISAGTVVYIPVVG